MSNDNKDYVRFLESAVSTSQHQDAPVKKILDWKGQGALPETLDSSELDDIVKRITKEDFADTDPKDTMAAFGDEMPDDDEDVMDKEEDEEEGTPEMDDLGESPLEMMGDLSETSEEEVDALLSETSFTDNESDILKRLVQEMDAMDYGEGDVFDDSEDVGEKDKEDEDDDDDEDDEDKD